MSVCRIAVEISDGKVATVGARRHSKGFFSSSFFFCLSSPSFAREDAVTIQMSIYKMRIGASSQVRESHKKHFEILMVENLGSVAFKKKKVSQE